MHLKLVVDPFLVLVNNPEQLLQAKNIYKLNILKEDYQKAFKKLTLFFLPNPVPFNEQSYQKQKGLETRPSRSSSNETSSEKFLY